MDYSVTMRHDEKSLEALAHMQYDLFCRGNRIARSALSVAAVFAGILRFQDWWGILLVAYGCYLVTSTYSAANHTAHKLAKQIRDSGMPFPASRYTFGERAMQINALEGGGKWRIPGAACLCAGLPPGRGRGLLLSVP